MLQISDYNRNPLRKVPIPESGLFSNRPTPARRIQKRVSVLLSGLSRRAQRLGKSIKTMSEFSR